MDINLTYAPYCLDFNFLATTSRGTIQHKQIWIIKITCKQSKIVGIGEAAPLQGLSIDIEGELIACLEKYAIHRKLQLSDLMNDLQNKTFDRLPSVQFALETAVNDLCNGGVRKIFDCDFYNMQVPIPINGLVWMGSYENMLAQMEEKLLAGYKCIKIKVGAINFQQECDLLKKIRNKYNADEITIRLDANGAWNCAQALQNLKILSAFDIHSIEQPIAASQPHDMAQLCEQSPIDIVLDEDLINKSSWQSKVYLLTTIKPAYIILKPTLVGGFAQCNEWIALANQSNIKWWITSALESNIGLNAICQYTSTVLKSDFPQGLGTGKLYSNNIPSSLKMRDAVIYYDKMIIW